MPALVWTLDPAELSPVVGNRNVFRAFLGAAAHRILFTGKGGAKMNA